MNKLNKAVRKFRFAHKSRKLKYRYLPEWVLSEASYFEKEITNPVRNYKVYKRGALVFIDFGVNVGNELSGNHFAIVLNKKDSKKNGVLTVVPVSSKTNEYSVELDGLISDKSVEFLLNSLKGIEIERKLLSLRIVKDDLTESEREERVTTSSEDGQSSVEHFKYITTNDYSARLKKLTEELSQLKIIVSNYLKFNKTSYAKCLDVRTISKTRVKSINKYDPVGKITVSKDTLDNIDQIIIENFTNR